MEKYINPLTDFGFKRIFANPKYPEITKIFLNAFLDLESPIVDLELLTNEGDDENLDSRGVIFDILCRDSNNREFVVELQRARQKYFVDRGLFYVCRRLSSQPKRGTIGEDRYKLTPIYWLGIINFNAFEDERYIRKINLKDENCQETDKNINFIYVELKKFKNRNPKSLIEQIIFFLKNEGDFSFQTANLEFNKILNIAQFHNLSSKEIAIYDLDLNRKLAEIDAIETAREIGIEKGIEQGIEIGEERGEKRKQLEIAKNLLDEGFDQNIIIKLTGLTIAEIKSLKD